MIRLHKSHKHTGPASRGRDIVTAPSCVTKRNRAKRPTVVPASHSLREYSHGTTKTEAGVDNL